MAPVSHGAGNGRSGPRTRAVTHIPRSHAGHIATQEAKGDTWFQVLGADTFN